MSDEEKPKVRVSRAPAPIKRLGASTYVPVAQRDITFAVPGADWELWGQIPVACLGAAVALSLGYEPPQNDDDQRRIEEHNPDLRKRMLVAIAHASTGKSLQLASKGTPDFGSRVELPAFAEWAISMRWDLPGRFPGVTTVALEKWRRKDLWSEKELQDLCCGLIPDGSRPATDELNEAQEAIRRAVLARKLTPREPGDATAGDRLYGHARFFVPQEATDWAAVQFPGRFPFKPSADPRQEASLPPEKPLAPKSKNALLKIIAALVKELDIDLSQPSKSAVAIARLTERNGAEVCDRTISGYLKEARALTG